MRSGPYPFYTPGYDPSGYAMSVRRAAFELAAACVEAAADQLTAALRDAAHPAQPDRDRVFTDESQLPAPEVGDRLSGLDYEGWTEEEWEAR